MTIKQIKQIYSIINIMELNGGFATPKEIETELVISEKTRRNLINKMREYKANIAYEGSDKIYFCKEGFSAMKFNIIIELMNGFPKILMKEMIGIYREQKELEEEHRLL